MSITEELREYVTNDSLHYCSDYLAIADRIDAEHESEINIAAQLLADAEKERDFNYADWQDCKQKVLQHNITIDELSAEIERLKDELTHRIELPKDADGEYIHVGDMMYDGLSRDFTPMKVKMLMLEDDEWMLNFGSGWSSTKNHEWHHYHAPTVEDVLKEMLYKAHIYDEREMELLPDLIAEYAAKLRLAGDAE